MKGKELQHENHQHQVWKLFSTRGHLKTPAGFGSLRPSLQNSGWDISFCHFLKGAWAQWQKPGSVQRLPSGFRTICRAGTCDTADRPAGLPTLQWDLPQHISTCALFPEAYERRPGRCELHTQPTRVSWARWLYLVWKRVCLLFISINQFTITSLEKKFCRILS